MLRRPKDFFARQDDGVLAPRRLFWTALIVRLLYMTLAHTWRVSPREDHFAFGFEAGRIARALVTGYGYADPFANIFVAHPGSTAWLPPAYPLLMAGVFRIFGIYTALSAWVLLAINCVAGALTASATWELGARFAVAPSATRGFESRVDAVSVARWSGWLWALYPAAMQYNVRWLWEMSLTTACFAWVLVLSMRMRAQPWVSTRPRWLLFGLLWGLIALLNSTLLLFLPVLGIWLLLGKHTPRDWVRAWTGAVLAGIVCLAVIAPWTLRNERVFHQFIPMRGNFGAELYLGNGPGANGFLMEYNHPFQSRPQILLYRQMGEVAYVRMRGAAAKASIAADPGLFVRNTLKRTYFFWASVPHPQEPHEAGEWVRVESFAFISIAGLLGLGFALVRRRPYALLWLWAFLLLPLPYYIVTVHARFRHPLEPLLCVLGVWLFQSADRGGRVSRSSPGGG
jgi:hypothetical protein